MQSLSTFLSRCLLGVIIVAVLLATAGMQPALAQEAEEPEATEEEGVEEEGVEEEEVEEEEAPEGEPYMEEIVVKGFRHSLQQAVDLKRAAVNTRDSIVTEDIAKMPDLNLAEAIQRVPGVAIVREGGEGRQMSLRGLGPEFTRVTVNGMEVPASSGGLDSSGGVNRGRSFDFNVFSAELFNRIDINKSTIASIEEGGLAGTVEMYTTRPLDNPGLRGSVLIQGGYNDLSDSSDPRVTAMVSTTNQAETIGFLVSAAYTERTPYQDGFGTVRWSQPDRPFAGNETSLSDAELNSLWYPRLPRQDSFRHDQERIGLSSGLQFRPTDQFELALNWVHSEFDAANNAYNSFAQFRRSGSWGFHTITPLSVTQASDGTGQYAVAGTFRGVALRTESRQTVDSTTFDQLTADFTYDISDDLILKGMIGRAVSKYDQDYFRVNIETFNPSGLFSYDFTGNPNVAAIDYDIDVTDPNIYEVLANERFERNDVDRTNGTVRLDLEWDVNAESQLKFGGIYNDREVDSLQWRQDADPPPVPLSSISYVFQYVDFGNYGSGTELDFLVVDYARAKAAYNYGSAFTPFRGPGRETWTVTEKTTGVYVDYNLDKGRFRLNAGLRYALTDLEAVGWLDSNTPNTETNDYNNLLPSINLAFDLTDELVLRAGVGRSLTRPGLSDLAPAKTVSDVNFSVSGGNSQLDPMVSDNLDLGLEWYFAENALLGFAVFYKDVDSFITTLTSEGPLRPEDRAVVQAVYPEQPALLDPSLTWTYQTVANAEGSEIKGFEIFYQQDFSGLPGFWSNFGVLANYGYVDAEQTIPVGGVPTTVPLFGMSENTWNATLYYEVDTFGVRLSMNSRDDYITRLPGQNGNVSENTTGPVRLDMSAFYHINDSFSLSLEAVNLTDEPERLFTTGNGTMDLVREYNRSGRQYFLGARYNF